ncbi:hypothetical protein BGZ49_002752 [Haplosporangium sp. Z 27]|nr:hypothetical protein BGZ49_002752 [Haplosporangium sp. Z 27]
MTHLTRHTARHDLKNGVESDISIVVFGKTYRLHRLILTQSKFFEGMLQGPWKERELNSIEIKFDDKNITEEGFEIAIKKLYDVWTGDRERGEYEDKLEACSVQESNLEIATGLFDGEKGINHEILITVTNVLSVLASGAYLGIDGLSKQCTAFVIQTISANTISKYVQFCHNCDYYPWSDQIAEACHTYLCRNGFDEPKIQCLCVFETLPCQWLLGILKSDAFWVPSEWERYKYCRRIAHNRRRRRGHRNVAIDDEEEQVYDSLFSTCITYMHMSFEQLQVILHDHDPLTGETFTRPEIIHEALWQQIELRATIDYCGEKDGPLDIVTAGYLADSHINEERYWWHDIIPRQDRTFLGDIYSPTQRLVEEGDGSLSDVESALDAPQSSIYPPFRFSVEFENFHLIQNNVRECSDVVFYGGSYWNVYIQKLPSPDGLKLGVYLHRHSQPKTSRPSKKPLPSLFSSLRHAADKSTGTLQSQEEKGTNVKQKDLQNAEKIQNRLNLVNNQPFKDANENEGFAQTLDLPDIEERSLVPIDESYSCYIDKRDKSKTWFKIFAASIGPTHTVTQFQSSPDDFSVMQSWVKSPPSYFISKWY